MTLMAPSGPQDGTLFQAISWLGSSQSNSDWKNRLWLWVFTFPHCTPTLFLTILAECLEQQGHCLNVLFQALHSKWNSHLVSFQNDAGFATPFQGFDSQLFLAWFSDGLRLLALTPRESGYPERATLDRVTIRLSSFKLTGNWPLVYSYTEFIQNNSQRFPITVNVCVKKKKEEKTTMN